MVISGESGGGNLSIAAVLRAKRGFGSMPDGVYAMCPFISGLYAEEDRTSSEGMKLPSLSHNNGKVLDMEVRGMP